MCSFYHLVMYFNYFQLSFYLETYETPLLYPSAEALLLVK